MNLFDFNQHFQKYKLNPFFEEKTYADALLDVASFSSSLRSNYASFSTIALKVKSPYLTFVAILSCLKEKKIPLLLSHLESDAIIEKLKEQIYFDTIIDDGQIENSFVLNGSEKFPSIDMNKTALIVFSSGTTSLPKGVALSFSNLYYSAKGFSEFFHQTELDCSLVNLPHHHVGGIMILWRAFFSGGRLTQDLQKAINFISLVPLQLSRMINDGQKLQFLKKIRVILVGGASLTQLLKDETNKHGLNLYETYGMSETTSLLMINGTVLPYREVKLDEQGFFNVKGKTLALGYYESNRFSPISNWLKTNDQGEQDKHQLFHFKQRADLIFISGGENINPLSIEEIVKQHPAIKDAYLIAIADEQWGEMGILLFEISTDENFSAEDLTAYLKPNIHPHYMPKYFFQTKLNIEGQLKAKRSELKTLAQELVLKNIFSYDYCEVKDAPIIIFFHGFMGDKEDLKNISHHLHSQFSRLYIDLPGHGQTKVKNFYSNPDFFQKLSAFIKLFSNAPIFYGYSMGGRIALHLALNYITPSSLILESAGLGLDDPDEQLQRQIADVNQFAGIEQNQLLDFLRREMDLKTDREVAQLLQLGFPTISKIRHGAPVSDTVILRIHECTDIPVRVIRDQLE